MAGLSLLFVTIRLIQAPEIQDSFELDTIDSTLWQLDMDDDCLFEITNEFAADGLNALKIQAPSDARCEIISWHSDYLLQWLQREPWGQPRSYKFSVYLPEDYVAAPTDKNEVIAQWHSSQDIWFGEQAGQGPPLALRIRRNEWFISYGYDDRWVSPGERLAIDTLWRGDISTGEWAHWRFDVTWSPDADGQVAVWLNGEAIAERSGPLGYRDVRGPYLKLGLYHPRIDHTILLDAFSVTNLEHE